MYINIVFLPLFSSFVVGFCGRFLGSKGSGFVSVVCLGFTCSLSLISFFEVGMQGSNCAFSVLDWSDYFWLFGLIIELGGRIHHEKQVVLALFLYFRLLAVMRAHPVLSFLGLYNPPRVVWALLEKINPTVGDFVYQLNDSSTRYLDHLSKYSIDQDSLEAYYRSKFK